jgi:hypothetical protein
MQDLNEKIGKEKVLKPIIGLHSKHEESSESELKAAVLLQERVCVLAVPSFPIKPSTKKHGFHQMERQKIKLIV